VGSKRADNTGAGAKPSHKFTQNPAIELRHLRYFLAVSELLHFGKAAERLHIAQPPLSQAIRRLEQELGVPLLTRTSRVVKQTDAGRIFAAEARKILAAFDRAVAEVRKEGGVATRLRIGCALNLPIERLLRFLTALHALEPLLEAQVTHLTAPEQTQRLRAGDLDIGIFFHAREYDDIELNPLFPGELVSAIVQPEHPLAAKAVLEPADVRDETLVTPPRTGNPPLYDRLLASFAEAGYHFRGVEEAGGPSVRDLMISVAEGAGVALWPYLGGDVELSTIAVARPLNPPLRMPDTVLAWATAPERLPGSLIASLRDLAADVRRASEPDQES
jgi:DNA-binding transcriptional LysR family regulator